MQSLPELEGFPLRSVLRFDHDTSGNGAVILKLDNGRQRVMATHRSSPAMIASASISTSIVGSSSLATWTIVMAGRTSRKNSE
jgi:hypothetical protein